MTKDQRKSYLHVALIISLMVNVLFIGAGAAFFFKMREHLKMPPQSMYDAVALLDESYQPKVKAILAKHIPKIEKHMKVMFTYFTNGREMFLSPDLTEEEIREFGQSLAQGHGDMAQYFVGTMVEINDVLPADQRILFLEEAMPKFPPFLPPLKAEKLRAQLKKQEN